MSDTEKNIHASCVAIGAKGVLLLGPSGAGKSNLGIVQMPPRARVRIALVVKLGKEEMRLPVHRHWKAPLKSTLVPQIALEARFSSSPAKIRAALRAFAQGLFSDTFITK
ncbi:MAG: hypothetical protein NTX21_01780 [Alphaproteobacteria bacterium]|nr:hypothetical protein [Alphaproteobacteria bacterium]